MVRRDDVPARLDHVEDELADLGKCLDRLTTTIKLAIAFLAGNGLLNLADLAQ